MSRSSNDGSRTERPSSRQETPSKDNFFQQKFKESLDSRLNFWKSKKSFTDSPSDQGKTLHSSSKLNHRKAKSQLNEARQPACFKGMIEEKLNNVQQIQESLSTALTVLSGLNAGLPGVHLAKQNLQAALYLLAEEEKTSTFVLKFLKTFIDQQRLEMESLRLHLKGKYKAKASAEQRSSLNEQTSHQPGPNPQAGALSSLKHQVQSLESLLAESDRQVLEKIEEINEKSNEVIKLKDYISSLTADLHAVKSDMKSLEHYLQYQQENYSKHTDDLLKELHKSSKTKESSERCLKDLQSAADNYKSQFAKACEALAVADDRLENLKLEHVETENKLKQENYELKAGILDLEKAYERLKHDLEIAQDRIQARDFIVAKAKEDQLSQLQAQLTRQMHENQVLIRHNKEITVLNHRLEEKIQRVLQDKHDKQDNPVKSEKKVKKAPKRS